LTSLNDRPHRFYKSPNGDWYVVGPGPEVQPGGEVLVETRAGAQNFRVVKATVGYLYVVDSDDGPRRK
jgi:hypothetical protein